MNLIRLYLPLAILVFGLCLGCTQMRPPKTNTLRIAITERVRTLDPGLVDDTVSASIIGQIYEHPLQYQYDEQNIDQLEPLLLKSMPEVVDDGRKYVLRLRDDITYHASPCFAGQLRAVRSEDIALAILRVLDPGVKSSGFWTFAGRLKGDSDFVEAVKSKPFSTWKNRLELYKQHPIEGIKTPDPQTLELEFKKPYRQLPYILAMHFLSPVPREALLHFEDKFALNPVGTGPFKLKSWRRNLGLELVRNDNYWGMKPKVESVEIQVVLESQPYWLKFMRGELDIIRVPKDNYDMAISADRQLKDEFKNKGVKLTTGSLPIIWYIGFNMADPIVGKDLLLRKAIAHAYDYNGRIELMTNNRAIRATSLLPPGIQGHIESASTPIKKNITEARKLLSRSQYGSKKDPPVLNFDLRGNSTTQRQWGEFFAKDMAELGIKVNINLNSFVDYLEKEKSGRLQIFMGGWIADYPDPENFLQLLYGPNRPPGPNASQYNNPEFNKLFEKLQDTSNDTQRLQTISTMTRMVNRDLPWVPDFYSTRFVLTQPWIENYKIHPFAYNSIKHITINDEARTKYFQKN